MAAAWQLGKTPLRGGDSEGHVRRIPYESVRLYLLTESYIF